MHNVTSTFQEAHVLIDDKKWPVYCTVPEEVQIQTS